MKKLLVIVGTAKCGTSTVNAWLGKHPSFRNGIEKEPKFFTDFHMKNWQGPASEGFVDTLIPNSDPETYLQNFPDLGNDQWAVDASTDYLWCDASPDLLAQAANKIDVRVVAIVRDPVARAISEYNHTLRYGWETLSFGDSLKAEADRIAMGYHPLFYHMRRSTVLADILRYKQVFGDDRFLLLDYADLSDPLSVVRRVCDLVGTPYQHIEFGKNQNITRLPRNSFAKFLRDNKSVKLLGRVLPVGLRKVFWDKLHTTSRNVKTVTEAEKEMARSFLKHEILACCASPEIPTTHWESAPATMDDCQSSTTAI